MKMSWQTLVASVSGFTVSLFFCLSLAQDTDTPSSEDTALKKEKHSNRIRTSIPVSQLEIPDSRSGAEEFFLFWEQTNHLRTDERGTLLARLLELPEGERRSSLAMTLLAWGESEPEAAILWCLENLERVERKTMLRDLATTWAHRDAMALAKWWAQNMLKEQLHGSASINLPHILVEQNPLAYATYMEMPALIEARVYMLGVVREEHLPESVDLPSYAEVLVGKVGYHPSHLESLKTSFGPRKFLPGKPAWNELFETVAVAWHRHSPEATEEWLQKFPKEAQQVARHRIGNAQ